MKPIIIYPKRKITFLYLLASVGFVLCCIAGWLINPPGLSEFHRFLMIPAGLFFTICALVFAKQLVSQAKPLLVVDERGIADRTATLVGIEAFPWKEITDIQLIYYLKQPLISVTLVDEDKYLTQLSPLKGSIYSLYREQGFPLVMISLDTSGEDPEEVIRIIEKDYGHLYMNKTKQVSH